MTVAEYAGHRRCSRRAVYDALRAGRIARLPGGRIDAKVADRAWKVNTLGHVGGKPQPKGAVKVVGADRRRVRVRVSDRAVATGEAEARRLLGAEAGTVLSFADARRARELVKLSREALALGRCSASWWRSPPSRGDRSICGGSCGIGKTPGCPGSRPCSPRSSTSAKAISGGRSRVRCASCRRNSPGSTLLQGDGGVRGLVVADPVGPHGLRVARSARRTSSVVAARR